MNDVVNISGDAYHYTYDSVGNRLTASDKLSVTSYQYDDANRLSGVNGVSYTFDANGNLLNDGVNTYAYDSANRLTSVSNQSTVSSYQYSGLGDRLSQTVNGQVTNYTLDLNAGLTQVLSESAPQGYGTTSYTYGLGRISQQNGNTAEYFLGDALGIRAATHSKQTNRSSSLPNRTVRQTGRRGHLYTVHRPRWQAGCGLPPGHQR